MKTNTIHEAISSLQKGELIVVFDDEDRENEGDLIGMASTITDEQVNFMIKEGGGLICVPMEISRLDKLHIPQMVANNQDSMRTKFSVSVDVVGTHTGISAKERAITIRALANPSATAKDFLRPGHIFPLECHAGGILERPGHTEAAVELARLAKLFPVGVICEILNFDGTMARGKELFHFADKHNLKIISVHSIIEAVKNK